MITTKLHERYNGHEITLKEVYPREYELWIDEKVYQNPSRIISRDERKLWQLGREIVDNLLPDEKHKIIQEILEKSPYLKSFYFRDLSGSELNRLSECLQSNNRFPTAKSAVLGFAQVEHLFKTGEATPTNSISIGSIVIGAKSPTSRGIVFSFAEEEPLVLWQSGFKSICRIEQLKLAPVEL
jgi:hypothetical protein